MYFKNNKTIDQLIKTSKILTAAEYIKKIIDVFAKSQKGKQNIQYLTDVLSDLLQPLFYADPTIRSISDTGSYTVWLYKTFINVFGNDFNKAIHFLSDDNQLNEIESYLKEHKNNHQNFPDEYKDIFNIKSFEQLENIVINVGSEKYQIDGSKADDIDVLYEDDIWYVAEPLTHEAAIFLGKHTNWCTAAKSKLSLERYNEYKPLTVIINKKTGDKWQTDPKTGWFNDANDNNNDIVDWVEKKNIPLEMGKLLQTRLNNDK